MDYHWEGAEIRSEGIIFVATDGRVIAQGRDEHAKNSPEMLAVFGGGRENSELPQTCLEREMEE